MAFPAVLVGVQTAVQTVAALKVVIIGEPTALHETPAAYVKLLSWSRKSVGQLTVMTYEVLVRVCVPWIDNTQAETELAALINPVCAAIEADRTLGGVLVAGVAGTDGGDAGYAEVGAVTYRAADVRVQVVEKGTTI